MVSSLVAQTVKNLYNEETLGLIPGSGRFPGKGNGYAFQDSCLENSIDRGAWLAIVHGVAKELDTTERLTLSLMDILNNINSNRSLSKLHLYRPIWSLFKIMQNPYINICDKNL